MNCLLSNFLSSVTKDRDTWTYSLYVFFSYGVQCIVCYLSTDQLNKLDLLTVHEQIQIYTSQEVISTTHTRYENETTEIVFELDSA